MGEMKNPTSESAWDEPAQALMEGDEVVALVFERGYAELFSVAPRMLMLLQRAAAGTCDFGADGTHDQQCVVCEAREILASFTPAPMLH
jgi:hypothetical protein